MYAWEVDQTNFKMDDYNYLLQELSKMMDIAREFYIAKWSFGPEYNNGLPGARPIEEIRRNDTLIRSLDLSRMTHETLALMKIAIYPDELEKMIELFPNLAPLQDVGPLEKPLYLREEPFNVWDYIYEMNIYL